MKEGTPQSSFAAVVPEAVKGADTLVLQTGSIEITNIDVNKAMMDESKEIEEYKNEWFNKVEVASSSLMKIAEECTAANPNLRVVIVKRLPRFDRRSKDILGIKSKLSEFGNSFYDQLLIKSDYSYRIHLAELNLLQNSKHLKAIIYGSQDDPRYGGVHMLASEASRHFTYRAVQVLRPILPKMKLLRQQPPFSRKNHDGCLANKGTNSRHLRSNHIYQQRQNFSQSASSPGSERSKNLYSEVLKETKNMRNKKNMNMFSVPTSNRFNPLNQENC